MAITKVRGGQLKSESVSSSEIKDNSVISSDIAPASLDGNVITPGTLTPLQVDLESLAASLAGNGLVPNGSTIDLNFDDSTLSVIADQLQIDTDQVTAQGNLFNGADQLVKILPDGKLPALDASNLFGIPMGTGDLKADGTIPLTANWNTGSFTITAGAFVGDGSGLTGIGAATNFVDQEAVSGTINGVNKVFTIANTPIAGSVHLYNNGLLLREGVGNDYTISGSTITTVVAPNASANLLASYRI